MAKPQRLSSNDRPLPMDEGLAMARWAYYGLSEPEIDLSTLLDVVQARIEWHQAEIARLERLKRKYQRGINNGCHQKNQI
jgi:hypothetical protein